MERTCRAPAFKGLVSVACLLLAGVAAFVFPGAAAASVTAAAAPLPYGGAPLAPTEVLGDTLWAGQSLVVSHSLESASGRFTLTVDTYGYLLLREDGNAFEPEPYVLELGFGWAAARLAMQSDGNLVFYTSRNLVVFESGTAGSAGERLVLQDDGNIVVYDPDDAAVFSLGTHDPPVLFPGGTVLPDERLTGPDGATSLVMQADGNLVLYTSGAARFATGTFIAGSAALFQHDGNFVVYSPEGQPLFSTGTRAAGSRVQVELTVMDREYAVLATSSVTFPETTEVLYSSEWSSSTVEPGMALGPGDRRTAPGDVLLIFQTDGNLVLYAAGVPRFATGVGGDFAIMQPDGNFVVYQLFENSYRPRFNTRTSGSPGSRLVVQSDANVVIYTPANRPLFSTVR